MTTSPLAGQDSFVTTRDDTGRHLLAVFEHEYADARLTLEEARRVNDATPEFKGLLAEFFARKRAGDEFSDEEVKSSDGYPKGFAVVPIADQIAKLIELFPGLDGSQALALASTLPTKVPVGADGWFAIPTVAALARVFFADVSDPAERYCKAASLVLSKIGQSRRFYNYRVGEIDTAHLRQSSRTIEMLERLAQSQPGDILIVAAQLGMRHRGRSVRRVRVVLSSGEFGLGAFAVGCVLLTHPSRLQAYEDLWIDCAGDEFDDSDSGGRFGRAPYFVFNGGKVRFDTLLVSDAHGVCGSASGFSQ